MMNKSLMHMATPISPDEIMLFRKNDPSVNGSMDESVDMSQRTPLIPDK